MLGKVFIVITLIVVVIGAAWFFFNPVEKFKEGRDKVRIADLKKLKESIDFYITKNAKVGSPLCRNCNLGKDVFAYRKISISEGNLLVVPERYVNSHGWVPIDFSLNAELFQTPFELLPVDPLEETFPVRQKLPLINSFFPEEEEEFVYTFTPGEAGKYKLTAKMESKMGLEEAKSDGGRLVERYEVGEISLLP